MSYAQNINAIIKNVNIRIINCNNYIIQLVIKPNSVNSILIKSINVIIKVFVHSLILKIKSLQIYN